MSERNRTGGADGPIGPDETLERLFERASPRPSPPEADAEAIRKALHAEWHSVVGGRLRRTRAVRIAAAAAVAALLIAVLVEWRPEPTTSPPPAIVAEVERALGAVEVTARDGTTRATRPGDPLVAGQSLTTLDGGLSLALSPRGSLRIGNDSRVTLTSASEIELSRGAIYFDSGDSGNSGTASARLAVRTPLGMVSDVGTQFSVRVERATLDISVRHGAVTLARGFDSIDAGIGERIRVTENGSVDRGAVALYGAEWEWVEELAPAFDIEGQTLTRFFAWIEEQTGRRVAYATRDAEQLAAETVLRGAIDLEPMAMLAAVLATTDLDFALVGNTIVVSVR